MSKLSKKYPNWAKFFKSLCSTEQPELSKKNVSGDDSRLQTFNVHSNNSEDKNEQTKIDAINEQNQITYTYFLK